MTPFEQVMLAGWGDMDFNAHMRNTAFLDKAADIRMLFLAHHGFTAEEMHRRQFGPVVMRDEVEYFREVRMMERVRVTYLAAGASDDFSRFRIRNEFWREDGVLAARVTSTGGWLDLATRKLIMPPDDVRTAIATLVRTPDFETLPSSIRAPQP